MPLLKQAWLGLKQNQRIVFAFLLLSGALTLAFSSINQGLGSLLEEDADSIPAWFAGTNILLDLLQAALRAACYAIFLAMLGAELDKPLWKYGAVREALQRFFLPWFIMILGLTTLVRMQEGVVRSGSDLNLLFTLEFFLLLGYLFAVPLGAAIMFLGRFQWSQLGEAITPLWRMFSLTALVLLLNFGQYIMLQVIMAVTPEPFIESPFTFAILDMPLTLMDILAFTMCWEILRLHRTLGLDQEE